MNRDPMPQARAQSDRAGGPPAEALLALRRSILDEFQRFARGFGLELEWTPLLGASPAVNMSEQDGVLHVVVDLPGLSGKDVEVTLEDDTLTVKGERRPGSEVRGRNLYRRESQFGPFQRSIRLPVHVRGELAAATLNAGMLSIDLPVLEAPRGPARKIPISAD